LKKFKRNNKWLLDDFSIPLQKIKRAIEQKNRTIKINLQTNQINIQL